MKTALQVTASSVLGLALIGLALFWPAGTFDYWQAWVFLGVFVVLSAVYTVYVGMKNPEVLRRRMHAGPTAETRPVQKIVSSGVVLMFFALLVVSAFDHRFGWSNVPTAVVLIGDVSGSGWAWHHHARGRAKQLCRRQYHRRGGPESGVNRTIWVSAASDVFRQSRHAHRHPPCARFLLGARRSRPAWSFSPLASSTRRRR